MTRNECKNIIVKELNSLGGVRQDEFVAWRPLYLIEGFSEIFHPEIIQELIVENQIMEIKYVLPDKPNLVFSYLLPKGTKIV